MQRLQLMGSGVGSTRDSNCTLSPANSAIEHYLGHISKCGVDVGYTRGGAIVWAVFALTANLSAATLVGNYAGASVGATLGVGAGVHALLGGFKRSISLQPASIEGNARLNAATRLQN